MVKLATSNTQNTQRRNQATALKKVPEEHLKELQFRLAYNLQNSLNLDITLESFLQQVKDSVSVSGMVFVNPQRSINIQLGDIRSHSANYKITSAEHDLGELRLSRGKRFAETELAMLEMFIGALFFPLRNALQYLDALESSMRDPLTGIGNRSALDQTLRRELQLAKRHDSNLSLLVVDIDHFKEINDTLGHQAGDRLLQILVKSMQATLRETDQIFRYGGEEFTIVLPNTNSAAAKLAAERIRIGIARTPLVENHENHFVTVSVGISSLAVDDTQELLFKRADSALYEAKNGGRNQVVLKSGSTATIGKQATA